MTKVAKKETTALAKPMENVSWGSEGVDASDVVIPKLLLMQGLSKLVSERKAQQGDIVRSTTAEILGNDKKHVEVIPLSTFKTWKVEELVGGKFEYRAVEPITMDNANAPLEWNAQGKSWRRNKCLNFYVLLPQDIKREAEALKALADKGAMPNPSDALLPCVITFMRTSYGAGKDLITHFARAQKFKVPPALTTFKLFCKLEKNDKGSYFTLAVEEAGRTSDEDLKTCKEWYDIISKNKVKIDDSDLVEEVEKPARKAQATTPVYDPKDDMGVEDMPF